MASTNPAISNANLVEKVRDLEAKAAEQAKELNASLHAFVNERLTEIDNKLQEAENDIEAIKEALETTIKEVDKSKEDAANAILKQAEQIVHEIKHFTETYSIEHAPVDVPPSAQPAEQLSAPSGDESPQSPEVHQNTGKEPSRSRLKCKNDRKRSAKNAANRGGREIDA